MKSLTDKYFLQASLFLRISILVLTCVALFYLGKHWSDGFQQIIFFNSQQFTQTPSIEISPNLNKTIDFSDLIGSETDTISDDRILHSSSPSAKVSFPPVALPPPPPPLVQKFGIVDVNGTMAEEFEIGEFDPQLIEEWGKNETVVVKKGRPSRGKVKRFSLCKETMRQYIPCLDNVEAIKMLKTTEKGEMFERLCPGEGRSLNCLVPAPANYKNPIPWPRSRDEVWFSNVPYNRLVEDKGGQNWISRYKDKFRFPGGGANQYLDQISRMVPNAFGRHTRVALDIGCGVASFGAFLLSRNVITLSVAPKDIHENQIQFALERGVPAMVAVLATHRLLYPSQAFDLIHCSRCTINWTRDDGILLLEVNRILRAGGYFVWAPQPVYKHEDSLQEQWKEMEDLTTRLCWKLVKKEGYLAIWKKPLDNTCYNSRDPGVQPPLCDSDNDPDSVWYIGLKACITPLPGNGYGANVSTWPARLYNPPDRLQSIQMDAYISRNELFKAELKYWDEILGSYIRAYRWKKFKLRNVLDMRAGFGGFAAALYDKGIDCWVLNVVPISGPNTLPVIYDRGLIGVMHDWCEPFDTYPRTYDLLHAAGLFAIEQNRCSITSIMLEMDRILRPGGRVYIRDYVSIIYEVQEIAEAMGWHTALRQTSEGPHASWKILTCDKRLLRS